MNAEPPVRPTLDQPLMVKLSDLMIAMQRTHMALSQMADQKASILMGATFVIFTITIGQASSGRAPAALLILGAAAFLSAVLAVLAILPASGAYRGKPNLLFFGSFTQMSEDDYVAAMFARMVEEEDILESFMRDVYQNGQVLAKKKYLLLGYAYRVFLVGLSLSFAAFVGQHFGLWRG